MIESVYSRQSPNHLRCLIVEDNYFAADIMSIFLQRNGIGCEIAKNGEIGLHMYLEDTLRYHVIFCDLQMPVMSGYEMMQRIRSSGLSTSLTIPIVAMSGTIIGDAVDKGGFNYFLKKPFELKSLTEVIDKALNAPSLIKSEKSQ